MAKLRKIPKSRLKALKSEGRGPAGAVGKGVSMHPLIAKKRRDTKMRRGEAAKGLQHFRSKGRKKVKGESKKLQGAMRGLYGVPPRRK